jgi:hypothetical protein
MKNFKILTFAVIIFSASTAVLANFRGIENNYYLDNDFSYSLKTQYDPAIDAIENGEIGDVNYSVSNLNQRIRILTNNSSYKSAVNFAEKFANNSSFSTPVVESVGANTLAQFFANSKNSGDIIVSTTRINSRTLNSDENSNISELRVIEKNGNKYFVYAKDLSPQSPVTTSIFKNFVIDNVIKTYSL